MPQGALPVMTGGPIRESGKSLLTTIGGAVGVGVGVMVGVGVAVGVWLGEGVSDGVKVGVGVWRVSVALLERTAFCRAMGEADSLCWQAVTNKVMRATTRKKRLCLSLVRNKTISRRGTRESGNGAV